MPRAGLDAPATREPPRQPTGAQLSASRARGPGAAAGPAPRPHPSVLCGGPRRPGVSARPQGAGDDRCGRGRAMPLINVKIIAGPVARRSCTSTAGPWSRPSAASCTRSGPPTCGGGPTARRPRRPGRARARPLRDLPAARHLAAHGLGPGAARRCPGRPRRARPAGAGLAHGAGVDGPGRDDRARAARGRRRARAAAGGRAAGRRSQLRALPFVETGRDGLVLHEAVQQAFGPALRSADPARYRQLRRAAWRQLREEAADAGTPDHWRYTVDSLYLIENPVCREAFFPSGPAADGRADRPRARGRRTGAGRAVRAPDRGR